VKRIKVIIVSIIAIYAQVTFSNENSQYNIVKESLLLEIKETLRNLNSTLNYTTIEVRPRTLLEIEVDDFGQQVSYTSAHDPIEQVKKIPDDLNSKNLTLKLIEKFSKIEKMVSNNQEISNSSEWFTYQNHIKEYFRLRKLTLYRSSRHSLKDGTYEKKFNDFKFFINENTRLSTTQNLFSVKSLNLELTLNQLKNINSQLMSSGKTSANTFSEANVYAFIFFLLGLVSFIGVFFYHRNNTQKSKEIPAQMNIIPMDQLKEKKDSEMFNEVFYYSNWIKKFEESINSLNNELYKEEYQKGIVLNAISVLGEAKVGLQLANNQNDYEFNLSKLKDSSSTIEDYFSEENNESQKYFNNVIFLALKLSNAIETNKTIINESITDEKNNSSQVEINNSIKHAA
jgi:hypothetical protein